MKSDQLFTDETDSPPVADRSTLERYANCPRQGHALEHKLVSNGGPMADVGRAVHDILSSAITSRIEGFTLNNLRDAIEVLAANSRPDIQPEVIAAVRRSYPICDLLCRHSDTGEERNPEDIICYDGGEGERSGQIAADLEISKELGSVRLTCELDLLMATESPEEVVLVDHKSGWKQWNGDQVKASFQFQFYAYLIMQKYPKVRRVTVIIYMTREGGSTSPIEFTRENHMWQIGRRIATAARLWLQFRGVAHPGDVDAWPGPEKCAMCSAVQLCADKYLPDAYAAESPENSLRRLVVLDAASAHVSKSLSLIVRKGIEGGRGPGDIVVGSLAFGTGRLAKSRAKPCAVYSPGKAAEE